jgi:nucleoside phosphorylase
MKSSKKYSPALIITALPFESRILLNHHNMNIKPKKLTTYQLRESIYLIEVPIGFKFDLTILKSEVEKISPKLIINFGICGALDSSIPMGSPFHIQTVYHLNKEFSEIQLPKIKPAFQSASLLTVDEAVLNAKRRDELRSKTGCRLVDMEAFHIARFCEVHRLPLLIVKIASDSADEDSINVIKTNRSELKQSLTEAYLKLITNLSQ